MFRERVVTISVKDTLNTDSDQAMADLFNIHLGWVV